MSSILITFVQTTLSLAIAGLVVWFLLRNCRSSRLVRIAWCLVMLQGIVWFQLPVDVPVLEPEVLSERGISLSTPLESESPVFIPRPERPEAFVSPESVRTSVPEATSVTPVSLFLIAWITGMVVLFAIQIFSYLRMLFQLRNAVICDHQLNDEWNALLVESNISPNAIRLLITDHSGPGLLKLLRGYAVVVPQSLWQDASPTIRRGILRHELSHYLHHDLLKSFLLRLITLLHWFNPVAHLAVRRFDEAAEWRCDAEAFGCDEQGAIDFVETLLVFRDTTPVAAVYRQAFCGNNVITRVKRLIEHHQVKGDSFMKKTLIITTTVLLLCLGMLQFNLTAKPVKEAEKPAQVPNLDEKLVKIMGKAILPDGTPAKGFKLMIGGKSKIEKGSSNLSNDTVADDGTIVHNVFPHCDYMIAILDRDHKWAAPYLTFSVDGTDLEEELIFQFEQGVKIEGIVRDKTTNLPIPNLEMKLHHMTEEDEYRSVIFDQTTDENGHYEFRVAPKGIFYVTVGTQLSIAYGPTFQKPGAEDYERKVKFSGLETVSIDFNIPGAFVGRVLKTDGTPAQNVLVQINAYKTDDYSYHYSNTDPQGKFIVPKRLKNVVVHILTHSMPNEAYINWFDDDLPKEGEAVFQLRPACQIQGRLINAATNQPMSKQLIFYGYSDEDNPERKEFLPSQCTTDDDGNFTIRMIPAGVRYNLFIVPGRQSHHGGGPYEPYVEIATLVPEKDGETIDLGEITMDLSQTVDKHVHNTPIPEKNQP